MANLEMQIKWQRRRAIYTSPYGQPKIGIKKGDKVECNVWGLFQVSDGEDVNPYFVVELADGRCTYVAPEDLKFIEDDEGNEINDTNLN